MLILIIEGSNSVVFAESTVITNGSDELPEPEIEYSAPIFPEPERFISDGLPVHCQLKGMVILNFLNVSIEAKTVICSLRLNPLGTESGLIVAWPVPSSVSIISSSLLGSIIKLP